MAYHKAGHKFVEFCSICHHAVAGLKAWEGHCQEHIDRHELPLRCDFVKFRRAIVYPGRCMTCTQNERLPPSRRLYGFRKQVSWKKHINDCFPTYLGKLGTAKVLPCPDPNCSTAYESEQDLWYHLQYAYSYPARSVGTKTKKNGISLWMGDVSLSRKSGAEFTSRKILAASSRHQREASSRRPDPFGQYQFLPALAAMVRKQISTPPAPVRLNPQSLTSISSPSLSFADGENLCVNEHTTSPSSSSWSPNGPSAWGWTEGRACQADTALSLMCHDMFQTTLEDKCEGGTFDIQPHLSQIFDPVD